MKDEAESLISRLSLLALSALRDVWPIWLAVVFLTTLPYVAAALRTPTGYVFTGVLTAYDDTFSYFAWMRQSADGHLLMCDPYTSEPQQCEFFLPLWNMLGFFSRVTHVPIALAFHLARVLAALGLLIVARAVAGGILKSRRRVRYSLWLYALSGGLGWVVYAFKNGGDLFGSGQAAGSADLNLPEAIAFRSMFSQVHFVVGTTLVCGAIALFFSAMVEKKTARALKAGMLVSLLAVVHPYMVVVVCGVAGVALLGFRWLNDRSEQLRINTLSDPPFRSLRSSRFFASLRGEFPSQRRKEPRRAQRAQKNKTVFVAAAFAAGAIPGVGYLIHLNRSNEVLREWLRITDTFSPPPLEYVLGFGIVGALAVVGFRLMWGRREPYGRLLLTWAVVQAALLYAPVSYQRRFVEGLQLPLAIAASVGLFWIARRAFKGRFAMRNRKVFMAGALAFASLTNVGFVVGQMVARGTGSGSTDPRRYLRADFIAAMNWLKDYSEPDAVLFSSYLTGNVAPSMTGLRVFLGHYAQTLHSDEKGAQVTAFYTNVMAEQTARELFAEHRVRYVIYGQFEREISGSFAPPNWLTLAYRTGQVEVFEVVDARATRSPIQTQPDSQERWLTTRRREHLRQDHR
jgi:hypothetical protein